MVWLKTTIVALALSQVGAEHQETVLLDFQAPWCGPCRQMQPIVDALESKGYPVRRVDRDANPQLARQFGVSNIPCFVMIRDGKEVDRVVGATSYQRLERMFDKAGWRPLGLAASAKSGQPSREIPPERAARGADEPRSLPPAPVRPVSLPGRKGSSPATDSDWERFIAATVRLRVEDPDGHSCGTGTIIDAREGQALVLTCGHIFRDSKGKGRIEVDLFGENEGSTIEGRLVTYDLKRDLALLSITPPRPVAVCPVASPAYKAAAGDAVVNVGCNNGNTPTARDARIMSLDKYLGPPNLQVSGLPVEGRSGGGLFSSDGRVIGVCNAADPEDREGLYAGLRSIHDLLDSVELSFVYKDAVKPSAAPAVEPPPALAGEPAPPREDSLLPAETAAIRELDRQQQTGAEVICIVRDPANPGGKSEIFVLNNASPAFLRALAKRQEEARGGPRLTSYEVPAQTPPPATERRPMREPILDSADNPRGWPTRR